MNNEDNSVRSSIALLGFLLNNHQFAATSGELVFDNEKEDFLKEAESILTENKNQNQKPALVLPGISSSIILNPNAYLVNFIKNNVTSNHELYDILDPPSTEMLLNLSRPGYDGEMHQIAIGSVKRGWIFEIESTPIIPDSNEPLYLGCHIYFNLNKSEINNIISERSIKWTHDLFKEFEDSLGYVVRDNLSGDVKSNIYNSVSDKIINSRILQPVLAQKSKKELKKEVARPPHAKPRPKKL